MFGELGPTGHGAFSVSESGALVYGNVEDPMTQLVWFDRLGKQLEPVAPAGTYFGPALSPDGRRVAVVRADPKTRATDLWLLDLSRPSFSRFTFDSSPDGGPSWSPDGSRIAFGSLRRGRWELYIKASSGAGMEQQLPNTEDYEFFGAWSPDGTFLVARGASSETKGALWAFPLDHRKPFHLLHPATLQEASSHFHAAHSFLPMDAGSPTCRMNQEGPRFTFKASHQVAASGKSRTVAEINRDGAGTSRNCST